MARKFASLTLAVAVYFLAPTATFAQSALAGAVKDTTGAVAPTR